MTAKWRTILILSLIGNLSIVYVAYKAYEYRCHINHFLDKYTQVVAEFSGRSVYEEANAALRSDAKVTGRVVFLGTQVTEVWDVKKFFPDYETVNRGVGGQRVAGFLLRFRPDVIELFPEAVVMEISSYNFRPNVTIKEISDYIVSMAELARAHDIRPVLTTVAPPRAGYVVEEHSDYEVRDSVVGYNRWLLDYASTNGFPCADFFEAVTDEDGFLREDLSSNRVDLNDKGYESISRVTADLLKSFME